MAVECSVSRAGANQRRKRDHPREEKSRSDDQKEEADLFTPLCCLMVFEYLLACLQFNNFYLLAQLSVVGGGVDWVGMVVRL